MAGGTGVPEPVRAWLSEIAEAEGVSERELLDRLLSTDGEGGEWEPADAGGRLTELEGAVAELDAELHRMIEDVRERVVQLKLEGETKAEEGHEHPETAARLDRVLSVARDLGESVDRIDDRLGTVETRTDEGFENFEEVLEYLVETTDDLHDEVARLAEATLDQQERVERLAVAESRRGAADELRSTAAGHGVTTATCESCGGTVPLDTLAAPECPHCGVQFTEIEPRRGFFRSSVLHAGQRPALEGEVAGRSPELRSLVADAGRSAPPVDGGGVDARSSRPDDGPNRTGPNGPEEDEAATGDRELTAVTGIGPAYAERLQAAGVETVGELALADPETLAANADIEHGRVERLVDRAREKVEAE